jgi:hypothetical protein
MTHNVYNEEEPVPPVTPEAATVVVLLAWYTERPLPDAIIK